jgi:hypothetical protein
MEINPPARRRKTEGTVDNYHAGMNWILAAVFALSASSLHAGEYRVGKSAINDLPLFNLSPRPKGDSREIALRDAILSGDPLRYLAELRRQGLNEPPHRNELEDALYRRARFLKAVDEAGGVEEYLAQRNAGQTRLRPMAKERESAGLFKLSDDLRTRRQIRRRLKRNKAFKQLVNQLELLADLGGGTPTPINKPLRTPAGGAWPGYPKKPPRALENARKTGTPNEIDWDKFAFWAQGTNRRFGAIENKRFILRLAGLTEIEVEGKFLPIDDPRVTDDHIASAFAYNVDQAVIRGKMAPLSAPKKPH